MEKWKKKKWSQWTKSVGLHAEIRQLVRQLLIRQLVRLAKVLQASHMDLFRPSAGQEEEISMLPSHRWLVLNIFKELILHHNFSSQC